MRAVSGAVGAITVTSLPVAGMASGQSGDRYSPGHDTMTIQQVLDLIIANAGGPFPQTVDTVKSGDPTQPVKGIVTTMFATVDVIKKAIAAGANLIIAHEPTYYNHADSTEKLENDDVYRYKSELLAKNNIVVWRCHDYIHSFKPDGVYEGVLAKLKWKGYAEKESQARLKIPATTLGSVISHAKKSLSIPTVRYMGDQSQTISSVLFMVGAPGGPRQIAAINEVKPDLVIIGELVEWETMEYMRDLRSSGRSTAMIILGHIPSEEPGMEWLVSWLKPKLNGIPVQFITSGHPVKWA